MRIGYPCINTRIGCTPNRTFRLASYSEERMLETAGWNIKCLERIVEWNIRHGLLFFRIGSGLIPFGSHPANNEKWKIRLGDMLYRIGNLIEKGNVRISMHPDQFVVLNTPHREVLENSTRELEYHCNVLDLMGLGRDAKVQIHVGGAYGDKKASVERFVKNFRMLGRNMKRRTVIENDDRLYSLAECLSVSRRCGMPVVFDSFHHECLNAGEGFREAARSAMRTWKKGDGPLMCDYSSQKKGARRGSHAQKIDIAHFRNFISQTKGLDFDIMFEIKNKEKSALRAKKIISEFLTS